MFFTKIQDKIDDKRIESIQRETYRKKRMFEAQKELWTVEKEIESLKPIGQTIKKTGSGLISGLQSFGEYSQKVSNNLNQNLFGVQQPQKPKKK